MEVIGYKIKHIIVSIIGEALMWNMKLETKIVIAKILMTLKTIKALNVDDDCILHQLK